MRFEQLTQIIEELAPLQTQESWDNSGIQVAAGPLEINNVLTSLEVTDAVIDEAKERDADLIITHHPLIFGGLKAVDYREAIGSYIIRLVNLGISVYSCHTPFDKLWGGNNDFLAEQINLQDIDGFQVKEGVNLIGRTGQLQEPMTLAAIMKLLANKLSVDLKQLRAVGRPDFVITKVGICTGAGADLMDLALENGCQLFITGDLKYHDAQKAKAMGLAVIDAGHYGTEKSFAGNFAEKLAEKTAGAIAVFPSQVDIDPFERV